MISAPFLRDLHNGCIEHIHTPYQPSREMWLFAEAMLRTYPKDHELKYKPSREVFCIVDAKGREVWVRPWEYLVYSFDIN